MRSPRPATIVLLLLIAAAYAVPRCVALRGVSSTSELRYVDVLYHLLHVDLVAKRLVLPAADPFLARFPEVLQTDKPMRWPPGTYHAAAPWARLFGPLSIWTPLLTNLLFTAVLLAGVIGLGAATGQRRVGLWAALLTVLCPPLVAHSWYLSLDYPLVAMVTVGLLLLWRTDGFARSLDSLALALWSALGLWVKLTYALYLLAPSLAVLALGISRSRREPRAWSRRLGLALGAAAVTLGVLLLMLDIDLRKVWGELMVHLAERPVAGFAGAMFEPWTLRWAGAVFLMAAASYPWALLVPALPAVASLHRRRVVALDPGLRWLLLAFLWGGYVALTLMLNKMERYLHPLYPVLCLLTAWWVMTRLPARWRTTVVVWIVTAYAAVLWMFYQSPRPWFVDRRSATAEAYLYETRMPGGQELDALRRLRLSPLCDLRPLDGAVRRLLHRADQISPARPVGVLMRLGRAGELVYDEPRLYWYYALLVAGAAPERFVIVQQRPNQPGDVGPVHEAPLRLVLHDPAVSPGPGQVLAQRPVRTSCGRLVLDARLSLVR